VTKVAVVTVTVVTVTVATVAVLIVTIPGPNRWTDARLTVVEPMLIWLATVVLMLQLMLTAAMLIAVPPNSLIRIQLTVVPMDLLLIVAAMSGTEVTRAAMTVSVVTGSTMTMTAGP
jgi:hypothetical protein